MLVERLAQSEPASPEQSVGQPVFAGQRVEPERQLSVAPWLDTCAGSALGRCTKGMHRLGRLLSCRRTWSRGDVKEVLLALLVCQLARHDRSSVVYQSLRGAKSGPDAHRVVI